MFLAAYAPADMDGQFINLFGANDHSGHVPANYITYIKELTPQNPDVQNAF